MYTWMYACKYKCRVRWIYAWWNIHLHTCKIMGVRAEVPALYIRAHDDCGTVTPWYARGISVEVGTISMHSWWFALLQQSSLRKHTSQEYESFPNCRRIDKLFSRLSCRSCVTCNMRERETHSARDKNRHRVSVPEEILWSVSIKISSPLNKFRDWTHCIWNGFLCVEFWSSRDPILQISCKDGAENDWSLHTVDGYDMEVQGVAPHQKSMNIVDCQLSWRPFDDENAFFVQVGLVSFLVRDVPYTIAIDNCRLLLSSRLFK